MDVCLLRQQDPALLVMAINGTPRRLMLGTSARISSLSPEFDKATHTSAPGNHPRSLRTSPGCMKKAGVPVLARVAAILRPMMAGFAHAAGDDAAAT